MQKPRKPRPNNCLRVAAAQTVFARTIDGNLAKLAKATATAATAGADVLLFPECATTGYDFNFSALTPAILRDVSRRLSALANQYQINLVVGTPFFHRRRLCNGFVVLNRQGHLVHGYAKCQLVEADRKWFTPGDGLSLFSLDDVMATGMICHERRFPELVRLPVMAGASVIFHPNAGMDALAVSRAKRRGRDGIVARAFENGVYYVFANSVGPQGNGNWSAGDSKIVAPDGSFLQLADNRHEDVIVADLDLDRATRRYALDSMKHPKFLAKYWRGALREMRLRIRVTDRQLQAKWL